MKKITSETPAFEKNVCLLAESRITNGICNIFYTEKEDICKIKKSAYYMLNALRYSSLITNLSELRACDITAMFISQASAAAYIAAEKGKSVCFDAPSIGHMITCRPKLLEYAVLLLISNEFIYKDSVNISLKVSKSTVGIYCSTSLPDKSSIEYSVIKKAAEAHSGRLISYRNGIIHKTIISFPIKPVDRNAANYEIKYPYEIITDKFSPAVTVLSQI